LVDHLALDHAEFRGKDLPGIEFLLVAERLPAYPDGYVVKLLLQEFLHFEADFEKHMAEEEEFLFPKILRNEACLRHPKLGPEVHRGSVNLYLRFATHKPDEEFKRMIVSIQDKLRNQHVHRPAAELAHQAQAALDAFAKRLLAHADLETNSLFPRAGRQEQQLYAGSAPGVSLYPDDAG
jgi:iron-sulfur cluster repair protein YtfE (RIC family)